MAAEQDTIMQAIAIVLQAMTVVRIDNNDRMQNAVHKIGRPAMQQSTFNLEAEYKNSQLKNFI